MSDKEIHPNIPDEVILDSSLSFGYDSIEKKDRIGVGSGADVYEGLLAVDDDSHRIALKEPRFEGTVQTDIFKRFEEQAETWFNLDRHDNIVSVYGYDTDPLPWVALEYMDGGTLMNKVTGSDISKLLWMSGQIAQGIHYGHRHGIAHLHLSPNNILLSETPKRKWPYPKVSDWGIAQLLYEHSNGEEGLVSEYAAPEQLDPEEYGTPDEITDIYQLGAIAYELLTGRPPFTGSAMDVMQSIFQERPPVPTEIDPELPPQVDGVILKALQKQKADRYESMVLLQREFDRMFEEHTDEKLVLSESTSSSTARIKKTAESTTDTSSYTEAGSTDTSSSSLSRRAAVGILAAGISGGGAYTITQSFSDNSGGGSVETGEGNDGDGSGGSDGSLSPKWEQLLWDGFATADTFIAENPTPSGGAIAFVTPDGEQTYVTQSIGPGYSLEISQGNAVARNSDFVFAQGTAIGPDVEHARIAAFGRDNEVGIRQWTHRVPDEQRSYIPHISADEERLYYMSNGDHPPVVRALDSESGDVIWENVFTDVSMDGISLHDSTLVVVNSGSLEFVDADTGKKNSTIDIDPEGFGSFSIAGDVLYTAGSEITSYNLSNRQKQWAVDSNREATVTRAGPNCIETDESTLYTGAREGYLTAYSLTDGTNLWQTRAEHNIVSTAAASGLVWAIDSVGNLSGFDTTTGENAYTEMDLLKSGEKARVAALGSTVLVCVLYANDNVGQAYDVDALLKQLDTSSDDYVVDLSL